MDEQTKRKEDIFTHRVITMLNRQEIEFMDRLGKDALFSTGHKLSYNDILKGLLDLAMEIGISGEKVGSLDTFKAKMLKEVQKRLDSQDAL